MDSQCRLRAMLAEPNTQIERCIDHARCGKSERGGPHCGELRMVEIVRSGKMEDPGLEGIGEGRQLCRQIRQRDRRKP